MSKTVIRVENLGKQYQIGAKQKRMSTLRESLNDVFMSPFRRARSAFSSGMASGPTEQMWALHNLSFEVGEGEVVGIIGRNGAGKSTLLKILSRITEPTEGRAVITGRVGSLLEVGTGFHPELTGRENIFLNGAILGMKRAEINRKFDEIVEFSGIERMIDTPVKRYSSGMYVRLAFAVAAHLEPEILIVDEVLAVGDLAFQKKCLGKIGDITRTGRTVLFVSHNIPSVANLCTRCLLLESGEKIMDGDTDEVIAAYVNSSFGTNSNSLLSRDTQRLGTGTIRFTDFYLENTNGERLPAVQSGQDVVFAFAYEASVDASELNEVSLGFALFSEYNQNLFVLYNDYYDQLFNHIAPRGVIKCRINKFPLSPGQYTVPARLLIKGIEGDRIEGGVGQISVVEGNFFKNMSGSAAQSPDGQFYVDGVWSQVDQQPDEKHDSVTSATL
jgi:lipopolysaccharide transport system ATP-binding protein